MQKITDEIDRTVAAIKSKDNSNAYKMSSLIEFEFIFFIVIEIVRYELLKTSKLSDLSSKAVGRLFTFQCFEYYYRDFPEIYEMTSNLFNGLRNYNEKLNSNDLSDDFDIMKKGLIAYIDEIVPMLNSFPSE